MVQPAGEPRLPILVKILRLLGARLGLDVFIDDPSRYGCDLGRLNGRIAAAWIAELTHLTQARPAQATRRRVTNSRPAEIGQRPCRLCREFDRPARA